ncbi:MAG: ADP-ribosylglycohydrolase family protein [Methylophaga sp.]|nr:ADP-ribosylglycohydrolase family protein [Methylophaga sp.]
MQKNITLNDRYQGCLLGLACGDAVGTTLEFKPRDRFKSITDMIGGGKFRLEAGQWTDDTSMALCLAESLIERQGFDAKDQMQRYWKWVNEGYYSCKPHAFGIGKTIINALLSFNKTGEAYSGSTSPTTAGNGSIMRLAPVVLYYYPDYEQSIYHAGESSKTTHGAEECVLACQLLASVIFNALAGKDKHTTLFTHKLDDEKYPETISSLMRGDYCQKSRDEIKGSGYVIESLEAALWCFYSTDNFKDAILLAANLCDDADTTAAICGQVAGAYYGVKGIPQNWLDKLAMMDDIVDLSENIHV